MQEDVICLMCTSGDSAKRGYLAAEGFGSQLCHLEEPKDQVGNPLHAALLGVYVSLA